MSIRSPLQLLMGLLCATLMILSSGAGQDRALAQSPCDSLYTYAYSMGDCCFQFYFGRLGTTRVTRITINPTGNVQVVGAQSLGAAAASYDSTQARYSFIALGNVLSNSDSMRVCFRNNGTTSFRAIVRWYNGDQQLCMDTVTLQCSTTPPPQRCFSLWLDSIKCGDKGTYRYSFLVTNQSSFTAQTLSLRVASPSSGVTLSPSTINFANGLPPGQTSTTFSTVTISGSQATAGRTVLIIGEFCSGSQRGGTGGFDSSRTCCTDSMLVTLPQCGNTGNGCFQIDSSSISCAKDGYMWCFTFRNRSSRPFNSVTVTSGTNGASHTYTLQGGVQPNSTGSLCVNLAGGQAGQFVTNTLRFCYNIIRTDTVRRDSGWVLRDSVIGQECCSDTVSVRLPQCGNTGCMQILEPRIVCGNGGLPALQMTVKNVSNFTGQFLNMYVASPAGVTLTPGMIALTPPLAPNGTVSLGANGPKISGNPPAGTLLTIIVMMCDSTKHCCTDTLMIQMPRCGDTISHDCCASFRKSFTNLASSGSSSGFGSLTGWMLAGPSQIRSISATIVSAAINGQPAYGYFNFGLLYNAFGVGTAAPPPYGSEEIWTSGTGINMMAPGQFLLSMKFPPLATNAKRDTLSYCIKFRYTDVNCVTCDTTICFRNVRRRFTGNGVWQKTEKSDAGLQGAPGSAAVTGELTGANTGTMKIVFPQPPVDLGPVNYVGVRIASTDPSVSIVDASAAESGHTFTSALGSVISAFSANAGDEVNLQLTYSGLGGRTSLEHQVSLMYTLAKDPNSILVEDMVVTLSKSGTVVTDVVEPTHAGMTDAYTFAIHLSNKNSSGETISKMMITTSAPTRIIAVGPTSGDTKALLQFGTVQDQSSNRNFVGEIVDGGQIAIAPNMEYGPIYLTLVGHNGEVFGPTVHFVTLNANDQVISEGDVTLSDPAAGVTHQDEGTAATGAMLRQSFPNPTTGSATIQFHLMREEQNVTLVVTDVKGSEVAHLIDGESLTPGEHAAYFDTRNLPAGTYYYTLRVGSASETKSMQVVK